MFALNSSKTENHYTRAKFFRYSLSWMKSQQAHKVEYSGPIVSCNHTEIPNEPLYNLLGVSS